MGFKYRNSFISKMLLAALLLAIVNLAACTFREAPGTDTGTAPYDTAQNSGTFEDSQSEPPELTTTESSTSAEVTTGNTETNTTAISTTSSTPDTTTSLIITTRTSHTTPWTTYTTPKVTYTTPKETYTTPLTTKKTEATTEATEPPLDVKPLVVTGSYEDAVYGIEVKSNEKAIVDSSNKADGFLMIRYIAGGTSRVKVTISGPGGYYNNYDLNNAGNYEQYPLMAGNGTYTVSVLRNTTESYYVTEFSTSVDVSLNGQFAPYIHSNQMVFYSENSRAAEFAHTLTKSQTTTIKKVEAIYNYIVSTFSYDYNKARTVKNLYVSDIDQTLNMKKGICLDYATLITAMLRSMGIPTKMVFGYVDATSYHAWINVYVDGTGWINGIIYFNGVSWKLMDPTFASTSASPLTYVPNESRYVAVKQY